MADPSYISNAGRIVSVVAIYACGRGSFPAEELGGTLHSVTVLIGGFVIGAATMNLVDTWFLRREQRRRMKVMDSGQARGRVGVTARLAVPVVVASSGAARPGFRARAGGPRASEQSGALSFQHGRTPMDAEIKNAIVETLRVVRANFSDPLGGRYPFEHERPGTP